MSSNDRPADLGVGSALVLLAAAVLWSARSFPVVPGQKLGAGFLPMLVGAGLLVCGLALIWRWLRAARRAPAGAGEGAALQASAREGAPSLAEHDGSAIVVVGVIVAYLLLADRLGFLVVAPLALIALCRAFGVGWWAALAWGVGGTIVVHLAFYKLLRVPLPWGVLRPFY